MEPRLLAFDTSTERMAVALADGARGFALDEPGGAAASARLLPAIEELLHRAGLAYADLDGIAFGRGPGAFTGLRTSCAVAQGLAFGLKLPVLPMCSLMLVAEDARGAHGAREVAVAMDARMDEVYAARFRFDGAAWQVLDAPALYTLPALAAHWAALAPGHLAGSACAAFGERLAVPALHRHAPTPDRAAALLRLAQQQWQAGVRLQADAALPLYLRDKVALTTREREAARP
jgi:tRNA threonylcarbamoyladenosine biosynthesis protein TsaB